MKVHYTKRFKKQYAKLSEQVRKKFHERLTLYINHSNDPLLRIHKLSGEFAQCVSINITGDYRLIFSLEDDGVMLLVAIGTHSQLYG